MTRVKKTEAPAIEAGAEAPEASVEAPEQVEVTSFDQLTAALAADDRPVEKVTVHEWTGKPTFYLRGLTGHDRDTIENTTFGEGLNDISAKLVARALSKPDGTPLIPKGKHAEAEKMLTMRSAGGLLRLQRVARRLSKMDTAAIDELEQALKANPSVPSGTD